MSSSKLAFLALVLALYASDHFLLLHCQEPAPSPGSPWSQPSPPAPPADIPSSPSPITETPGNDIAPTPAPPPQSPPWPPSPSSISGPPPPDVPSSPSSSSITEPPGNDIASTPAPPSPSSIPEPPIDKSPPSHNSSGRSTPTGPIIAGAVIGSLLVGGLCVGGFVAWIWRKRGTRQPGLDNPVSTRPRPTKAEEEGVVALSVAPSSPSIGLRLGPRTFTYQELKSATDGFSDSNFLGEGGYGTVHKGVISDANDDGQTLVAVKQLKSGNQQAQREFRTEIQIINRVHHKHLVSLVGYCIDEAHSKMMLVYEFVPNKTLAFHLHEKGTGTIDWKTRMKIAIGSAKGLAYLHEECHPRIIHGDIKATNILVDDSFEPKASCGFWTGQTFVRVAGHNSNNGKFWNKFIKYVAPEYAASGKLTEKSDVFSFGVVLLELITGRKPVGDTETFPNGSMVEWARTLCSEALESRNFEGIADERLQNDYDVEEMFRMVSCAANCVRHSATTRPPMTQVVQALEGVICLDNDLTEENPARRKLIQDMEKLKKMALSSYSTSRSDHLHSSSSSTSASGSKLFR